MLEKMIRKLLMMSQIFCQIRNNLSILILGEKESLKP